MRYIYAIYTLYIRYMTRPKITIYTILTDRLSVRTAYILCYHTKGLTSSNLRFRAASKHQI